MKTFKIFLCFLCGFWFITSNVYAENRTIKLRNKTGWSIPNKAPFKSPVDATIDDNNTISIEFIQTDDQIVELQIKDWNGNVVYNISLSSLQGIHYIDMSGYECGMYQLICIINGTEAVGDFEIE